MLDYNKRWCSQLNKISLSSSVAASLSSLNVISDFGSLLIAAPMPNLYPGK